MSLSLQNLFLCLFAFKRLVKLYKLKYSKTEENREGLEWNFSLFPLTKMLNMKCCQEVPINVISPVCFWKEWNSWLKDFIFD